MQTFLSVGFSPSAALVTWQLELSGAFQTYTYWPTHTVDFNTEIFGNHRFQPNQLDISTVNESQQFDFILLCIPSLKDVNRMVKKISKIISRSTVVLVNIADGASMVQRLVKAQLPKTPVAAFICDFPVRHIPNTTSNIWEVIQWGNSKSPGPQMACHVEPISAKSLASLEAALSSRKMPCTHPKNTAAFLAVQWERTIFTVGFELMTILFNCPSVEKVTQDQMALPIIDGVVNELLMIASASGAKSLPSLSNFVQQAPFLTRKAPSIFAIPHASRLYYEFYNRGNIGLDLLLLCPIMLADDFKKARTPYLDSVYAFSTQLQSINTTPSDLFTRADLEARQRQLDREYEKEHGNSNTAKLEQQLKHALLQAEQREAQLRDVEAATTARENKLRDSEAAFASRQKELQAREEQLTKRQEALSERQQRLEAREQGFERQRNSLPPPSQAPMSRSQSSSKLPTMPNSMGMPPQTPRQQAAPSYQGMENQQPVAAPMQFMSPQHRPKQGRQMNKNQMLDNHAQLTGRMPPPQGGPGGPHGHGPGRRSSQLAMAPPPEQLNMMSLTQSKNRRYSLRNTGRSTSMASMSAHANGGYSQTFQLDDIVGLASQDRYSLAGPKRQPQGISSDHSLGANRPYSHGFSNPGYGMSSNMHDPRPSGHSKGMSTSKADIDFSNFGYSYDNKLNTSSQGSGSLSGNSRSTPPASPSATPPTPNTLDATDMKSPYSIPGI